VLRGRGCCLSLELILLGLAPGYGFETAAEELVALVRSARTKKRLNTLV